MTIEQFGQTIQNRYPQYQGMDPAQVGQKVIKQYPQYQGMVSQPQQNGGNLLGNLLTAATRPFVTTGKNLAGAAFEGGRTLDQMAGSPVAKAMGNQNDYLDKNNSVVQNPFLNQGELQQYNDNPQGQIMNQAKASAGMVSYAVPFGKGANLLTKAIIPGAASGALQSASDPNSTPESIAGGAALGAAGSGLTSGVMKMLNIAPKAADATSEAMQNMGNSVIRSQYNLPQRMSAELRFPDAINTVVNTTGITNRQHQNDLAHNMLNSFTDVVNRAVSNTNGVSMKGIDNFIKDKLAAATELQDHQRTNISNMINGGLNYAMDGTRNIVDANPDKVMQTIRNLEANGADHAEAHSRNGNVVDKQAANTFGNIADELRSRLFNGYTDPDTGAVTGGANDALHKMLQDPKISEQIHAIDPKLGIQFDQAAPKGVQAVRHMMAPYVAISKANNYASNQSIHNVISPLEFFGAMTQLGSNPINALAALAAQKAVNSNVSKGMIGNLLMKASRGMPRPAPIAGNMQNGINSVASHIGPLIQQSSQ